MGAKEERMPVRFVFGFAGQIRPLQVLGGKCQQCKGEVWIDYEPTTKQYRETVSVHHGCEVKSIH